MEKKCGTCEFWIPDEDRKYRHKCKLTGKEKWEPDGKDCFCWRVKATPPIKAWE